LAEDSAKITKPSLRKAKLKTLVELGWCELVHIPSLGLENVHAKMDSGAATSSIHATRIKAFEKEGANWVSFWFKAGAHEPSVKLEAPIFGQRQVRSSNGKQQLRYVIKAQMCLGALCWTGQLTLANRGTMAFPVLIGRRSLRRGFTVNSAKKWTLAKPEGHPIMKDEK
jgi:hypothetical protein